MTLETEIKANQAMAYKQEGRKEYHENLWHTTMSTHCIPKCQWDKEDNETGQLSETPNQRD